MTLAGHCRDGKSGQKVKVVLGTRLPLPTSEVISASGRERAAQVAATAATIAHGWDRLAAAEIDRLCEALDDHARSYLRWLGDTVGPVSSDPVVHELRGAIATLLTVSTLFDRCELAERATLAAMLGRAARRLVAAINEAGDPDEEIDLDE
jgi:hypothetical protein